jgi:copper(I)-binding protein
MTAAALLLSASCHAAGRLEISDAWIRTAPPGAMMLVGYAQLRNTGDAPVTVTGADSRDFRSVSLHESIDEKGVARMRPLGKLSIEPGASVTLAPGGKHLMLMQPAHEMKSGSTAEIHIATETGDGATAKFTVGESAP